MFWMLSSVMPSEFAMFIYGTLSGSVLHLQMTSGTTYVRPFSVSPRHT